MCAWATCYSGSNNVHFDFPPIMADGRNYASWQPEAVINNKIQKSENIKSNWDYRRYMTHHGLTIMEYNMNECAREMGTNPEQVINTTPSPNVPHLYDKSGDPPFGYHHSDLKDPYLSREKLESRLNSPGISIPKEFMDQYKEQSKVRGYSLQGV